MNNATKIITAALVGAAAGTAAGMLFAPASGKHTRRNIGRQMRDLQYNIQDLTEKSRERLDEIQKTARSMAKSVTG